MELIFFGFGDITLFCLRFYICCIDGGSGMCSIDGGRACSVRLIQSERCLDLSEATDAATKLVSFCPQV